MGLDKYQDTLPSKKLVDLVKLRDIASQMIDALKYLHLHGIVH
jgi:hypothetical protein